MGAISGLEVLVESKGKEGIQMDGASKVNVATGASVAAARPSERNIFLAPEGDATVAPIPGFHEDLRTVEKHSEVARNNPEQ